MVLALARPSEAWCFPPGADFFEAVLLLAAAGNRISLEWHGVFPPGADFFEAVLVLAAAGNRISRNMTFF